MSTRVIGQVLLLGALALLLYRQWTRKGTATWGPIESVQGDAPDPNAATQPAGPIGAPGSDLRLLQLGQIIASVADADF